MRKFILIDQSIVNVGGHYLEYAQDVLLAAKEKEFETILVTNKMLKCKDNIVFDKVVPVYKYGYWDTFSPKSNSKILKNKKKHINKRLFNLKFDIRFSRLGLFLKNRYNIKKFLSSNVMSITSDMSLLAIILLIIPVIIFMIIKKIMFNRVTKKIFCVLKVVFRNLIKFITYPFSGVKGENTRYFYKFLQNQIKKKQFTKDTQKLFNMLDLKDGDIVFIPTISELEMLGLIDLFKKDKKSKLAGYHLLFRKNIFNGRETSYSMTNENVRAIRDAIYNFIQNSSDKNVNFYTDTDELTEQYNFLGVTKFHTLPIPHTKPKTSINCIPKTLKIVYAGDARTEKGYQYLPKIVQDLWNDYVNTNKIKFDIQSNYNIPGGEPSAVIARDQLMDYPSDKVTLRLKPLSSEEYKKLIFTADINLILYDSENYYARSSGVLAESLSAGIPVIVPAATWMSKQFICEIYKYHSEIKNHARIVKSLCNLELNWMSKNKYNEFVEKKNSIFYKLNSKIRKNSDIGKVLCDKVYTNNKSELEVGGSGSEIITKIEVPKSTYMLFRFRYTNEQIGLFLKLNVEQYNNDCILLKNNYYIVENSNSEYKCSSLIKLENDSKFIQLLLSNAFDNSIISISDIEITFLDNNDEYKDIPLGAVGLVYSDINESSNLLKEIVNNYDHYRNTAYEFSKSWIKKHNGEQLVNDIICINDKLDCIEKQ